MVIFNSYVSHYQRVHHQSIVRWLCGSLGRPKPPGHQALGRNRGQLGHDVKRWTLVDTAAPWSIGDVCNSNIPIGSMVLLYMVTWIPSIYPSYVSIYTSTMDTSWDIYIYTSGGTKFMLLESFTKHPSRSTADHMFKSVLCGRCGTVNYQPFLNI